MEMLRFRGIVLREYPAGDSGKYIHVFTVEYGIIEISVRGGRKITSKSSGACQLFAYSEFSVRADKGRYYLDSSQIIHLFYEIRNDVEKLALADYIVEVIGFVTGHNKQSRDVMRLLLNSFHFIASGEREPDLIKCIFEMRLMTEIGMMPDVLCCPVCMATSAEYMCFDLLSAHLYCSGCFRGAYDDTQIRISEGTVMALRHIIFADFNRLFNFRLDKKCMKKLSELTERYLIIHLGRDFRTLKFYKSLGSFTIE